MDTVDLYHAFMYPASRDDRPVDEWLRDREERGILSRAVADPDATRDPRTEHVYLYDPGEPPLDDLVDWPNVKVAVPVDRVRVGRYDGWDPFAADGVERWAESLVPYREWDGTGTVEYVVEERVDPGYVVDTFPDGL